MTQAQGRLPKKVLHVLSGTTGGATLSALGLMEEFNRRGIASCAACHDLGDDLKGRLEAATRGEVLYLPLYWWNRKTRAARWKRPLLEARQLLKTGAGQVSAARVARFAHALGVELVHTGTVLNPEGARAARALGLGHVWHVREMIGPGQPFRLPIEGPKLGRWLLSHASKVVANSNASAGCLRPWLPPDLLEVVPNGIDLARFQPQRDAHSGTHVVAMVGALSSRSKRHDLFVKMAKLLREKLGAAVELRVYGDDPQDDYAHALRSADVANGGGIRWMGRFDDAAVVMPQIDVLVQPSDVESFGRVIVEAMAAGVPVVGVKAGGAAEIVAEELTGLLARPNDAEGLAAHVERLLADPTLRDRMGRAGRERSEQLYSLGACADGIERVYRAALARPLSLLR